MGLASLTWCADPQNNLNTIYDGPALHTRGQARKRKLTVTFPPAKKAVQPELAALNKKLAEYETAQRQAEARIQKLISDNNWSDGEAVWARHSARYWRSRAEAAEQKADTQKYLGDLWFDKFKKEEEEHRTTEHVQCVGP